MPEEIAMSFEEFWVRLSPEQRRDLEDLDHGPRANYVEFDLDTELARLQSRREATGE